MHVLNQNDDFCNAGIRVGPTCVDGAFVRQTIPDIAKIAPYLNTQVDVDCKVSIVNIYTFDADFLVFFLY